jgi:hypothetical protein
MLSTPHTMSLLNKHREQMVLFTVYLPKNLEQKFENDENTFGTNKINLFLLGSPYNNTVFNENTWEFPQNNNY